MSPSSCCLPAPLPTSRPLPERLIEPIMRVATAAWRHALAQRDERRRRAALSNLSGHTLRDIGMAEYAQEHPAWPALDGSEWDRGRWR